MGNKGARAGALIVTERAVGLVKTGEDIATVITIILARGDGGFSSERRSVTQEMDRISDRQPDIVCDLPTFYEQALLYRLSGDLNPLHASPQVAGDAGYLQPILHGLCTMGVATHALIKECCHYEPERLKRIRLRFSAPVYPGETIRTEIWQEEMTIAFRCWSLEQEKMVIYNGYLKII